MARNWKALGLAIFAVLALGALGAQGASAVNHEFRSDGSWTVGTGASVGKIKFQVGAAGSVECNAEFEDQSGGVKEGEEYLSNTLTVSSRFTGCTFGGQAVTFNLNHCAFILSSDTTETEGKEHANIEIECGPNPAGGTTRIEIHTSVCTIFVEPQVMPHAIRYETDTSTSVKANLTAKNIVTGKVRNTAVQPVNGCLTFPTGAIGTLTGEGTTECFRDEGSVLTGTEKTTPQGLTKEGPSTKCSVK